MNARDELAKSIFTADNSNATDAEGEWNVLTKAGDKYISYAYNIADAILAAGYSKPRTVSTVAALDALPGSAVVKDALTQVFEKQEVGQWHDGPHDWLAFDGLFWDVDAIHLPATILYEPPTPDAPTETGTQA